MVQIVSGLASRWGVTKPRANNLGFSWIVPVMKYTGIKCDWQPSKSLNFAFSDNWKNGTPVNKGLTAHFLSAFNQDMQVKSFWLSGAPVDSYQAQNWGRALVVDHQIKSTYGQGLAKDSATAGGWFVSGASLGASVSGLYAPPLSGGIVFDLAGQYAPPSANAVLFDLAIIVKESLGQPMQATDSITGLEWRVPPALDNSGSQPWGVGISQDNKSPSIDWVIEPGDPLKPQQPPLSIKGSYYQMNNINLVTVQDRTPLKIDSFSVGMDIDSHSYSLNLTLLNEASYNKIVPMTAPVDVELSINGHVMVFMIESGGQAGQLASKTWKASGVSKTKMLGAPYSPKRSKSSDSLADAAGLAVIEAQGSPLVVNWPQGLQRDAVSWQMPGGVFSYEGLTPIDAIKKLAATVGAVLVPALDGSGLTVKPRWPLLPWQLDTDNADVLIHESMIVEQNSEYSPSAGFNEVWVSGETHGYQTRVYRADTGGTIAGPEIIDRWLTDNSANIQRGSQALAEASKMLVVSMSVIVLEQGGPGIITPASVIEIQHADPANDWRGLVLSNDISPGSDGVDLYQKIKIARPI